MQENDTQSQRLIAGVLGNRLPISTANFLRRNQRNHCRCFE